MFRTHVSRNLCLEILEHARFIPQLTAEAFSYKFLKLENVPLFAMEHGEQRGGRGLGGMNKTILSSRICVDVVVLHRKGTR